MILLSHGSTLHVSSVRYIVCIYIGRPMEVIMSCVDIKIRVWQNLTIHSKGTSEVKIACDRFRRDLSDAIIITYKMAELWKQLKK